MTCLFFMLKIETSTGGTNSMRFLVFRRDHLRSTSGIISVRDHLRSNLGIISGLGIICGRGSFAALYRSDNSNRVNWDWRRVIRSWYPTNASLQNRFEEEASNKIFFIGSTCHAEQVIKIYRMWLRSLYIFHLHLIVSKNTEKWHVFSNPRTLLIKHLTCYNLFTNIPYPWDYFSISCVPITFSSNIPYPGNFFREYPVSWKPLIGPHFNL